MYRRVQRLRLAKRIRKDHTEYAVGRSSVATSRHKTTKSPEAMHDARNDGHHIEHVEYRHLILSKEDEHGGNAEEERTIEHEATT